MPIENVFSSRIRVLNNPGTPTTTSKLKTLEPKIFPRAISDFFCKAALTETISSGKDVPKAIATSDITPTPIFKILEILIMESQ